jgi:hypothetical protein
MRNIRWNVKDFAAANDYLSIVKHEFQGARQNERELLADMKVPGYNRTRLHEEARNSRIISIQHLTRDELIQLLTFKLFP